MKTVFQEHHLLSDDSIERIWRDWIFVFDTNALLNMYRYSRETVKYLEGIFKELKEKGQLWMPHRIWQEFYENRLWVICEYEKSYDVLEASIDKAITEIQKLIKKDHPFINPDDIIKWLIEWANNSKKIISEKKARHPKWLENDEVLETLTLIFEWLVWKPYEESELLKINTEGKLRYEKKIPPGYKDDNKPEDRKYWDLIIWNQMIKKAKDDGKPIIFITGDVKEDWWLNMDGKRLMPHPLLKREMIDKAWVPFHAYTVDRFLEHYKKWKGGWESQKGVALDEIRKIQEMMERISVPAHFNHSFFDESEDVRSWEIGLEITNLVEGLTVLAKKICSIDENEEAIVDANQLIRKLIRYKSHIWSGEFIPSVIFRRSLELISVLTGICDSHLSENPEYFDEIISRLRFYEREIDMLRRKFRRITTYGRP